MSYLDAPRLHFSGWFQADVSTINNDVRTFQNDSFVPEYQQYNQNGSWNPEGTGIFRFLDCAVTGGALAGKALRGAGDDPAIGMLLENADQRAPGKLVDLDPQQQMVSQIWGMQLRLLDAARKAVLQGEFKPVAFCNLWQRQKSGVPMDQKLAANYQSVLEDIAWDAALDSPLLRALREATEDGLLSIAFNVYGYGRDATIPRYTMGHVVGSIGPYLRGEPKHFVRGRQMIAMPSGKSPLAPKNGVYDAQGQVASDLSALTLDLGNTLPIKSADSGFEDLGPLVIGVLSFNPPAELVADIPANSVALIGEVPYQTPDWYAQTAGVIDFDLSANPRAQSFLPACPLLLLSPQPSGFYKVLMQESLDGQYLRADDFVFRLDPGERDRLEFYATRYGQPLAGAGIALSATEGFMGGSGGGDTMTPPTRPHAAIPDIGTPTDAIAYAATATTDAAGRAQVELRASDAGPGRPRGYIAGQLYGIGYQLAAQPSGYVANPLNYVSVLVYSKTEPPAAPTWYDDIQPLFTQYGNLYPIMSRYVVDLRSYDSVITRLKALRLAFSLPRRDPNHMPVTRDLSAGDRATILRWLDTPAPDGLPLLGKPPLAPTVAETPVAAAAVAQEPAPVDLAPLQSAGKSAFVLQYLARRKAGQGQEPGDTP
ncbi:hypothetical protein [Lysobacter sp. Root604]|uniref:hypothetical protein n=1 Tax=Lysobacter sp. Root604 TaxID=1736568 RepID=UPI0007002CA0|nr:hypothetical protein [Lysobacter sp. Root604]KRA17918.1 hypothetical protein ASD69_14835 [Lysobacter sp. Root604]